MRKYTAGKSRMPEHIYDCVFCDHEYMPMVVVISELNSIDPLVDKLRKANERIVQLERLGTKNERGLQKGMAKLNTRIAELMKVNSELRAELAREQGHLC